MATIGYNAAVADAFGIKVTGRPAYLMWGFIHMLYLIGWGTGSARSKPGYARW
jgi:NADH:ubiquinone reductase (H+-translocating)